MATETETNDTGIRTLKAHLALNVRDVRESVEFYRKMFNIEPAKVRTGYAKFDVQNPPLNFTLNERPDVRQGAISHLGIQVASTADVLALRELWREAELLPREEMQTNCCYALQDKAWVTDPDGHEWEVFVVLEDHLPETQGGSCCATNEAVTLNASAEEVASAAACAAPAAVSGDAQASASCGCAAAACC